MLSIRHADFPADLDTVRALFREYADQLNVDLCFQGFVEELAGLPGKYARPQGCVLLAMNDGVAAGCVALRPLADGDAEMKRLYIRPDLRGSGVGRRLVEGLCEEARRAGYQRICLDTLPSMTAAQAIYAAMGFVDIEPYVFNPVKGTRYLGLPLRQARSD